MIEVNELAQYKQSIAHSFSRSAPRYDAAATVQKSAGKQLLREMQRYITVSNRPVIADIGCGTGCFYSEINALFHPFSYLGIDLAQGMLNQAKETHSCAENTLWLCDDAEYLFDISDDSIDIIFSNFALQWIDDLPQLVATLWRVLKPGGYCCFTSLGSQTLMELRHAWQQVDQFQHVNHFYDAKVWNQSLENQGFNCLHQYQQAMVSYYDSTPALLRSIRNIGANVVKRDVSPSLMSRHHFQLFSQAYEELRQGQGLPLTYIVDGWVLHKTK